MSAVLLGQINKHIAVLEKKSKGDDVKELGKILSLAKTLEAAYTDGRSKKRMAKEIALINEKISNAEPDKDLQTIQKKLEEVAALMAEHPQYVKRARKKRAPKKK